VSLDQQIEELRAELKGCSDAHEIAQIDAELRAALALRERFEADFPPSFQRDD
jgi:hypothetical protein